MYFTDKYELAENIDLLLTAYYQPSLDETDDYKASILTGVNFTVNENVSISLQFSSFYDSIPPNLLINKTSKYLQNFLTLSNY